MGRQSISVQEARYMFLWAVREVVPTVLDSLAAEPLRTFQEANAKPDNDTQSAFEAALAAWQAHWNLTVDWCADVATDTLLFWDASKKQLDSRKWADPMWDLPLEELPFTWEPHSMAWCPDDESREAARDRLLGEFSRVLDAYLDRVQREHGDGGHRTKGNLDHFLWLARRRCAGDTWEAILADTTKCELRTLQRAVKAAEELVGLPPAPYPPGPRPGGRRHSAR